MSKFIKYFTDERLKFHGINIDQNNNGLFLSDSYNDSLIDSVNCKFGNIIKVIYSRDNTVSLGMDQVLLATESCSPDVKRFIDNWILKECPALPSFPTDDDAFVNIIPRSIGSLTEVSDYLNNVIENLNSVSNVEVNNQS